MSRLRLRAYVYQTVAMYLAYDALLRFVGRPQDVGLLRAHLWLAHLDLRIQRRTDEAWRRRKEMSQ